MIESSTSKAVRARLGLPPGALGAKLEWTINHYIASQQDSKDMEKLRAGALPWLLSLPKRFQDEFEGMAEGANLPLQPVAEMAYIEECDAKQCSGAQQ